ncbi:MAG: NADPH:quinone oxidoreductase family protein [Betaproteobacteria bacterium]|nr:NADPH:quinone oxidoreductase family protein [Betaproteobacteria bacterium]
MRAVVCREFGDPASVRVENLPEPVADGERVRIAVCASGLSFANLLALQGRHQNRAELPFTPGTDVSGVVVECGPDVTRFRPGDRVAAALRRDGFAEQVVVPQRTVWVLPDTIDHDAAVQFPVMYGTAYAALAWRARVQPGETVLVHGAAGGSGMAAVQVARCLGARVVAIVGSADKAQACSKLGADLVVNHRETSFRDAVLAFTDGRGADVVFDPVGGDTFMESTRCIAPDGRLVVVGFAGGTIAQLATNIALVKNFDVIGLYWGQYLNWGRVPSHPHDETRVREAMNTMFGWHAQGRLQPWLHARHRLDDFAAALAALAAREAVGRVVLNPFTEANIRRHWNLL